MLKRSIAAVCLLSAPVAVNIPTASAATSQRALLQSRSATGTWSGVTYKMLAAGKGSVAVTWKKRGVTAFRWYVPASTTSTGLTVGATVSPPFNLTVR